MKLAFVAAVGVVACSSSQIERSPMMAPTARHAQPSTTLCSRKPAKSPETCNCKPSIQDFMPSTFWCTVSRKTPEGVPLNVCYTAESSCKTLRQEAINDGALIEPCHEQNSAVCFSMVQNIEQRVHWRCYATLRECESLLARWEQDQPTLQFGECSTINSDPRTNGEPRTAVDANE